MATISHDDMVRMRGALFFEGPGMRNQLTRFSVLLALAGMIATAGVIGDSTATVIGAMIVAPLMTPILGIVLAVTIGDRRNLIRSLILVALGAAAVILIGWLLGTLSAVDVTAPTNGQVTARVSPRTIDLVAALATGAVGAFALVRSDISDTLPGVAISISLVPPLAVVGLTLEAGNTDQAGGAMLLFLTNVAAILLTGVIVMAIYRVRRTMRGEGDSPTGGGRYPIAVIVAFVIIIAIPLILSGRRYTRSTLTTDRVASIARAWAAESDWELISTNYRDGEVVLRVVGPEPAPDPAQLRQRLDDGGEAGTGVEVQMVPEIRMTLPAD